MIKRYENINIDINGSQNIGNIINNYYNSGKFTSDVFTANNITIRGLFDQLKACDKVILKLMAKVDEKDNRIDELTSKLISRIENQNR